MTEQPNASTAAAVRLTSISHGAGCACKLAASELGPILRDLPRSADPAVLVGTETADDAGVYRLSDDVALVQTVDFFTPIVDDPYDFGRIAAANAFSDVYAMGGRPVTALNLVAFSLEELGHDVLREILRGGADVAAAASVAVIGGHSIDDREPKYGMAVSGLVHPAQLWRNSTARPGDVLLLTKPLGGGVVSTATKRGIAAAELIARSVAVMTTLNRDAAEAIRGAGPHAVTDITGFGLLGHLHELAHASGVAAEVEAGAVPFMEGVRDLVAGGANVAGGTLRNQEFVASWTTFEDAVPEDLRLLLCDAMTSGGLLAAVPEERAEALEAALVAAGTPAAARIGRIVAGEAGRIAVTGGG